MKSQLTKYTLLTAIAISLNGCAGFKNEGSMGVRNSPSYATSNGFERIYRIPSEFTKNNLGIINKGDYFSISLLSAHICGLRESKGLDSTLLFDQSNKSKTGNGGCTYGGLNDVSTKDRTTRGEVAIIVNAVEGITNSFNPSNEENTGRVIYYNDDVRESGQIINARNLPIYGPQQYNGDNITFDLWMLELDNDENKKISELLKSLSNLGQAAYPPSAPALMVLNTLGSAFLSGNQDDVEARINMRFDILPPAGSEVARLPLQEGYYAFVREENRDLNPEWDKFTVNTKMGELCKAKSNSGGAVTGAGAGSKPDPAPSQSLMCEDGDQNTYRDRTWFLIRIAKETAESALKLENLESISNFTSRMSKFKDADLKKTTTILDNLSTDLNTLACKSTEVKDTNGKPDEKATITKREGLGLQCK